MSQRAIRNAGSHKEWQGLISLFSQNNFTRGLVLKHKPAPAIHTMDSDGVATLVTKAQSMESLRTANTTALIAQIESLYENETEQLQIFCADPKNEGEGRWASRISPSMTQLAYWEAMVKSRYFHNNFLWGSTTYHAGDTNQVRVYDNLLRTMKNERGYRISANQIPTSIKRQIVIPPIDSTQFSNAISGFKTKAQEILNTRAVMGASNMVSNRLHTMTNRLAAIEQDTNLLAQFTNEIDEYNAGLEAFDAWMEAMPTKDDVIFTGNSFGISRVEQMKRDLVYMRHTMPDSDIRIKNVTKRIENNTNFLNENVKIIEHHIALATNHCDGVVMCDICAPSIKKIASMEHLNATIKQAKGDEQ